MAFDIPNYDNTTAMAPLAGAAVQQQASQAATPGLAGSNPMAPMAPVVGAPQVGDNGLGGSSPSFFQKGGGASMALGAIQTLGSLWSSFQQQKLAKDSLNFQKEAFNTNLTNQTKTYNTALEDRISARHNTEGKSQSETDSYIEKNKL